MTSSNLSIHQTTFNCGREEIHVDYFASSLYTSLPHAPLLPPDLLALSLQELAPIGFAFLGGSLLAPYFSRFEEAVRRALAWRYGKDSADGYELLLERHVGLTGIMVFARGEIAQRVRWIQEAGVGCGVWEMGNKGAVGVRLGVENEGPEGREEVVTFVSAHLAPHEEAWESRNEDWESIVRGLVFEDVNEGTKKGDQPEREPLLGNSGDNDGKRRNAGSLFDPPGHIFFAGDLNYRASDTKPDPQKDFDSWPQPRASESDPAHSKQLLKNDQLLREMRKGKTLHSLAEAPITFPPTYKYSSKAMDLAAEDAKSTNNTTKKTVGTDGPAVTFEGKQDQVWLWAKHRFPSWCDRILFLEASPPSRIRTYTALPIQPTSDHRPVVLSCTLPNTVKDKIEVPFKTLENWREKMVVARRYEWIVGLGAYLTLTGQGEALLAGTIVGVVGGYFVLSALLGNL